MTKYQGKCHCGAIEFSFEHENINQGLHCNCSICSRKGALMSNFTLAPDEINIAVKGDNLAQYSFDSGVAKHYFCKTCGIYPFHETMRMPGHYRVNLGCIDELDTLQLSFELFDGKSL